MRILILNWRDPKNPLSGGAEIVTMQHAQYWVDMGHQVTWFASKFNGSSTEQTLHNVQIVRGGSPFTVHFFAFLFYLRNKQFFDIVVDEIHGLPFFTPLYVRLPKVAFIHEVAGEIWDYMVGFPLNIFGKFLELLYLRLYKDIPFWTDAQSTVDELMRYGISRDSCVIIPCPITNSVTSKLPEKELLPTFLFVSRVVKMKGIEDVLEAFTRIYKILPSQLWVVGPVEASYMKKLQNIVRNNNIDQYVHFFGKVSESEKLRRMRKAHILLHASVKEGWGLVVLEAASQGTPAVVYNVSGLRDTVISDKTGILLKMNTPESMADAAVALFCDSKQYQLFQKNGFLHVRHFTWKKSGMLSLRFIKNVMNRKHEMI